MITLFHIFRAIFHCPKKTFLELQAGCLFWRPINSVKALKAKLNNTICKLNIMNIQTAAQCNKLCICKHGIDEWFLCIYRPVITNKQKHFICKFSVLPENHVLYFMVRNIVWKLQMKCTRINTGQQTINIYDSKYSNKCHQLRHLYASTYLRHSHETHKPSPHILPDLANNSASPVTFISCKMVNLRCTLSFIPTSASKALSVQNNNR